ncbi:hypothetical protein [Citrobacter portucalensis]|nr:hypothetical protein [Citrobacter portucalensis]
MNYFIRPATPDDINKIIEFTTQEAQESEGSVIDLVAVERGVSSAFSENHVQNIGSWKILQEQ